MHARAGALAVLLLAVGCSSGGSTTTGNGPTSQPAATSTSPAATSVASSGNALTISGFSYSPTPLSVAPGATVTVTNKDSADHTVTSDTSGVFSLDDPAGGSPVTFTAPKTPGTYRFHCAIHPYMHGTLVVTG